MASKADAYVAALREMEVATGHITMSALVTFDGLVMASTTSNEVNREALAAYSAATYKSAMDTMHEISGEVNELLIFESKNYRVVSIMASKEAVLVALTSKTAKIGIVLLQMNKTAEKLRALLAQD